MRPFLLNLLKRKEVYFFVLAACLFFLPSVASAGPLNSNCWTNYPNNGSLLQPLAGFPTAADIKLPDTKCKATATFENDCIKQDGVDSGGGWGCDSGLKCCVKPATSWPCWNNVADARRTTLDKTECMAAEANCTGSNLKLGSGFGCTGTNTYCCGILKAAGAAGASGAAPSAPLPTGGSTAEWKYGVAGGVQLVPCTKDGNCQIADLVQQAVNFARWLMGLAGALFLLVFVYGGAMYVMSFGRSDMVTKGKTALVRGAIGVVLVMGAWTIVSYTATSLGYTKVSIPATPQEDTCGTTSDTTGYKCENITAANRANFTCDKPRMCMSQPTNSSYKCCKPK